MKTSFFFLLLAGSAAADVSAPGEGPPPLRPLPQFAGAGEIAGFENPAVLSAAQMLGPGAVGPAHRAREWVPTDGYMAHFTIDSDYGNIECIGRHQAQLRIAEMAAIGKLTAVSKGDLFADALKRSIEQPIDAVRNIVKDPVGSAKAVPKTVGHFFKKVGQSISNTSANMKDRSENGDDAAPAPSISKSAKGIIGFDKAKLECAKQLGVDPYSDNARLQEEIEKVSWVFFSGGLPLRVGAAVVSGGASMALTATNTVGLPDEIYALTPVELAFRNQEELTAMGVGEKVTRTFLGNEALSITLRRSIIRSLSSMGDVKGRAAVVEVAAACDARRQVEFLDQALFLLLQRQQSGQLAIASLEVLGRLPSAVDTDGKLQIPAPVDFLSWTPEVAEFASRPDLLGRKPSLLLAGGASDRTRAELAKIGWTVVNP